MALMARIDDALSPIVVKELRQAVQSRLVVSVLVLFLLLQLTVMGIYLITTSISGQLDQAEYQAGREVFSVLQGILLGTCMLFLPAYTGARLAAERSDTNVDLLFITTLKPRAIISGKIVAALVLAIMIFSACLPFMVFTYFLRGVDLPSILCVIGLDFLAVMASVLVAIFVAVIPANRALKSILGLLALQQLIAIFAWTMGGTLSLVQMGFAYFLQERYFLPAAACFLLGVFGFFGLLFTWSVALVQPPSANRAWPTRLLVTVLWLAGGAVLGALAFTLHEDGFLATWIIAGGALLCLCLVIAVNEREQWAPRVARAIPRRWYLRIPAFFFFSGAAGGILHASLLFALTGLGLVYWYTINPGTTPPTHWTIRGTRVEMLVIVFESMLIAFLYTYAYCLSAVFLRRMLLPRMPSLYTWAIALILAALGSCIPLVIGMLWHQRHWNADAHYYYLLGNPMAAVILLNESRTTSLREYFLFFVAAWCGLVTLLNLRWYLRQMARFRPYHAAPPPRVLLVAAPPESAARSAS